MTDIFAITRKYVCKQSERELIKIRSCAEMYTTLHDIEREVCRKFNEKFKLREKAA